MNSVILIGRLTKDPELSYTTSQKAVCKFTLAVDRTKDGADFIKIIAWDRQAENCAKYLAKGRQAAIRGRIVTGSFDDRNGNKVYTTDVVADNIEFIGDRGENLRSNARNDSTGINYQPTEKIGFTQAEEMMPF